MLEVEETYHPTSINVFENTQYLAVFSEIK